MINIFKNTNKNSIQFLYKYDKLYTFENYNIVDENMNTLLFLACRANNPEIISTLISNGIDPLIQNKDGLTCLHISTYLNHYCCAGIILSNYEALNEPKKIEQILSIKDKLGSTVLHIAAEENYEEISLLFISYLIRNNIRLEMLKNNSGLTPLQLVIKNHNYKIALMYIKYLNLN